MKYFFSKVFFEYQLKTGVVLAFDYNNHLIWTSLINNPIAAVWELKNGQLKEKSLFKTRLSNRLAFIGEFNSTPYVIISSRIQQQLISNARKTKSSFVRFIYLLIIKKELFYYSSWFNKYQRTETFFLA